MKQILACLLFSFTAVAQQSRFAVDLAGGTLAFPVTAVCDRAGENEVIFAGIMQSEANIYVGKKAQDSSLEWGKLIRLPENYFGAAYCLNGLDIRQCRLSDDFYLRIIALNYVDNHISLIMFKLSGSGEIIWSKKMPFDVSPFSNAEIDHKSIWLADNDDVVLSLALENFCQVLRVTPNGEVVFSKQLYFDNPTTVELSFFPTTDGGYAGAVHNFGKPAFFKINANLDTEWCKRWEMEYYSTPVDFAEMSGGGFVMSGGTSDADGNFFSLLATMNSSGNLRHYYRNSLDQVYLQLFQLNEDEWVGNWFDRYAIINLDEEQVTEYTWPVSWMQVVDRNLIVKFDDNEGLSIAEKPDFIDPLCQPTTVGGYQLNSVSFDTTLINDVELYLVDYGVFEDVVLTIQDYSMALTQDCSEADVGELKKVSSLVSPNPVGSDRIFTLQTDVVGATVLVVHDTQGRLIFGTDLSASSTTLTLPNTVYAGFYRLMIINEKGEILRSERLIVE